MPGGVIEERVRSRIRRLYERTGWTQAEFAARVGRRQSWASKYLSGAVDADIDAMAALSALFRVPLVTLIGEGAVAIPEPTPEQAEAHEVAEAWPVVPAILRAPLKDLILRAAATATGQQSGAGSTPASAQGVPRTTQTRRRNGR